MAACQDAARAATGGVRIGVLHEICHPVLEVLSSAFAFVLPPKQHLLQQVRTALQKALRGLTVVLSWALLGAMTFCRNPSSLEGQRSVALQDQGSNLGVGAHHVAEMALHLKLPLMLLVVRLVETQMHRLLVLAGAAWSSPHSHQRGGQQRPLAWSA